METTTMQAGLNAVVINKIQSMIENKQPGIDATMTRLINEGKISQDYIAPIGVNMRINDHTPVVTFGHNGHVSLNMPEGEFSLHENAVYQLADKMGVPARYLKELSNGQDW